MRNLTPDRYQQFAEFMQAYQDMVFSTAVRLLAQREQAEDIVQDVFLKAYERFDQLQGSVTAGGWLKTVATNLALNHLSRHRRRWRLFSELQVEPDAAPTELDWPLPDTLLDKLHDQQQQRLLEQALQTLPEQQRVPLVLFHFEEMSYQQIAEQLRISLAKVKIDIWRGRIKLAKQLAVLGPAGQADNRADNGQKGVMKEVL